MLRFFCICGHSRGKHDNSTGFRFMVGGCNSCKCNKYKSYKTRNKKVESKYYGMTNRMVLVPFAFVMLFFFMSETFISTVFEERYLEISSLMYFVAFLLVTVYMQFGFH